MSKHLLIILSILGCCLFFSSCEKNDGLLATKDNQTLQQEPLDDGTVLRCGMDYLYPDPIERARPRGASDLQEYLPLEEKVPLRLICVNIHVMQDANGQGNWTSDQIDELTQLFNWSKQAYLQPDASSNPIPGVSPIQDTRIRFRLNRIEFYRAPNLINSIDTDDLFNEITARDPNFLNGINVFLTNGSIPNTTAGGFASLPYTHQDAFVVLLGSVINQPVSNYSYSQLLAHEFGHVMGLCHTYLGGGCSANCDVSDPDFLSDVFGTSPSNCAHLPGWGVDPFDNSIPNADRYTNNLMGGGNSNKWISGLQAAMMHRNLETTFLSKYISNDPFCQSSEPQAFYTTDPESSDPVWSLLTYTSHFFTHVLVGKFDADDKDDIFISTGTHWWVAESSQNFAWRRLAASNTSASQLHLADFDGDGLSDVFFADGARWQIAESSNGYNWTTVATSNARYDQIFLGQFDGDGIPDVFFPNGNEWEVAESSNNWAWRVYATSQTTINEIKLGDFDGDGLSDVFFSSGRVWDVAESSNGYSWRTIARTSTTPLAKIDELHIGYFDTDNKVDVFWATEFRPSLYTWGLSKSTNSYRREFKSYSRYDASVLLLGDFNGDSISEVLR
ncbi:MAG: FG-GAP-like repeat-containing protein [Bacteroidota bacterium]